MKKKERMGTIFLNILVLLSIPFQSALKHWNPRWKSFLLDRHISCCPILPNSRWRIPRICSFFEGTMKLSLALQTGLRSLIRTIPHENFQWGLDQQNLWQLWLHWKRATKSKVCLQNEVPEFVALWFVYVWYVLLHLFFYFLKKLWLSMGSMAYNPTLKSAEASTKSARDALMSSSGTAFVSSPTRLNREKKAVHFRWMFWQTRRNRPGWKFFQHLQLQKHLPLWENLESLWIVEIL